MEFGPFKHLRHADAIAGGVAAWCPSGGIGAGVIGLEVAAAVAERGCCVHVLEVAPIAMQRGLPPAVSAALFDAHRRRGVEVRFGARVAALEGEMPSRVGRGLGLRRGRAWVGVKPRLEHPSA